MIAASRRSFITGLVALVAAPAIIRASSLMPVNVALQPINLLTLDEYSKRILRPMMNRLADQIAKDMLETEPVLAWDFYAGERWSLDEDARALMVRQIERDEAAFAVNGAKVGDVLRIRLPADFVIYDEVETTAQQMVVPDNLALAAAAMAVVPQVLARPVTRRFWAK